MHLILGFGATGASYLRYLRSRNIPTMIMDSRPNPPGLLEFEELETNDLCFGRFDTSILRKVERILVSPGIEYENDVLLEARRLGIEILTDIELFLEESTSTKILVTGTNGKTTVVSMAGYLLSKTYKDKKVICSGNIGKPVLDTLNERHSLSVVEVSSFHLEHSRNLLSEVGVLLNVDQDHLDRHHSISNYKKIKEKILQECKIGLTAVNHVKRRNNVFNFIDLLKPLSREINQSFENKWPFHEILNLKAALSIVVAVKAVKSHKNIKDLINSEQAFISRCLVSLKAFRRLKHRFEVLGVKNGLTYINDSKSTNISSLLGAVRSAEELYGRNKTLLICGGDSKEQDFSRISASQMGSVLKIFIFGKDKDRIFQALKNKVPCILSEDLEDSINKAKHFGENGNVLLLSPACSSQDMFSSYKKRGEKFKQLSGFK